MIREIIVTSPAGVRLAFETSGDLGLELDASPAKNGAGFIYVRDLNKPGNEYGAQVTGVIPTSWLIELNEQVT